MRTNHAGLCLALSVGLLTACGADEASETEGTAGSGATGAAGASSGAAGAGPTRIARVTARAETDPLPGDPDDLAIWVHPTDPELSLVIATYKDRRYGGLYAFDLDGHLVQTLQLGQPNNVDLRYDFSLGGESVTLLGASDSGGGLMRFYKIVGDSGTMELARDEGFSVGMAAYGFCLYRSQVTGDTYAIVNAKSGVFQQYRLLDVAGQVEPEFVREFAVSVQPEGCVADDELGNLFIGEEDVGIWKFGAEPDAGDERASVDRIGSDGNIPTDDVEGLALYTGADGAGYLIASSQGDSTYFIYERGGDNELVGRFRIGAGDIDAAVETDGIDVANVALGSRFPNGLFVAHDDRNEGFTHNFKLASWEDIAHSIEPRLLIDTTPR